MRNDKVAIFVVRLGMGKMNGATTHLIGYRSETLKTTKTFIALSNGNSYWIGVPPLNFGHRGGTLDFFFALCVLFYFYKIWGKAPIYILVGQFNTLVGRVSINVFKNSIYAWIWILVTA